MVLAALLAGLAVVAAGCGKSADQKANEAYANSVCNAASAWESQVKDIVSSLNAADLSKPALQAKLTQIESATKTLLTQIKAVPPPNTSEGTAAKQQVNQLTTQLSTTVTAVKSAAASIPSNASAATIATTMASVAPQVASLGTSAKSTLDAIESASGSLADAFKSNDTCKSLTNNS